MTDEWLLEPLVARVVAWHNRHPLARRITPQQVQSLGFVALPFVALPFVALPFVAHTAAFSEDFIASVSPARVARWAARHAREAAAAPTGGPLRPVAVDDTRVPEGAGVVTRYAMTAAVTCGGRRTRWLIGPDAKAPVLGRRLWSRPRVAAAGTGVTAVLFALVTGIALPVEVPMASVVEPPARAAAMPPVAADPPEAEPSAREWPPDAEPRLGRVELPPLAPAIDSLVRDAGRQARASKLPATDEVTAAAAPTLRPAAARPAGTPQVAPDAVVVKAPDRVPEGVPETLPERASAVAAVPPDAFWAVTTRLLRTRAESLQWMRAVDELLQAQGSGELNVEMLPEGDDWRVVGWPFTRRADAERAQAMLLARGLKVEVVDF
jgi:hypothetical protein